DEIDAYSMDSLERLYIRLERWEQLKDIYAKKAELAESPDDKKQMLFVLGQVYDRELGNTGAAIETYQSILDIDADELSAIQALDRLYGQASRWYDLLQVLEREVELSDSTAETVAFKHRIGQLWEKELHDLARAIDAYREALTLDPQHDPTIAALSGLLHGEGEPVLAAHVLEPIYEEAAEYELLVDVYEVMAAYADDQQRRVELLARIAEIHERRLGRWDDAFEALGRALHEDSSHEATLESLERVAATIGAFDRLAKLYEQELDKTLEVPRQVDLLLRLARICEEELGQPARAIGAYRRVLDVDAECQVAVLALDRLFEQAQRWEELTEILRRETRLAQSDEEIIAIEFRLGQVLEQNLKDVPAAVDVYREILAQDSHHEPTLSALELLFLEGSFQTEIATILEPLYQTAGEWEKLHRLFEAQLERLTEALERQSMLHRLAELAEHKLGQADRAFHWWGAAFAEDPRSQRSRDEIERLARETGCWDDLVAVYSEVLSHHTDTDVQQSVLLSVARAYDKELRDASRAEEAYLRALGIDDKDAEALEALDRIYTVAGMHNELVDVLNRRVEMALATEDILDFYFRLGRIHGEILSDLDSAVKCYDKILEQESRNRAALEKLERIYFHREQWKELFETYEKMVDVARGDEELADFYARMARLSSEALESDDRAMDLWARVIDLRGEDIVALRALGEIYERRGMWRELVDILEREVLVTDSPDERLALFKRLGGVWQEKLDRDRDALDAWLRAQEVAPQDFEVLQALAALYRAGEDWSHLSDTLVAMLDAGQVTGELSDEDMIGLYSELGRLEGDTLGRIDEAVSAWRNVLALDPGRSDALSALEALFTREGRWEDCIDVLEKRAAVLDDEQQRIDTLLQAASIWEERALDRVRAAEVYERVRSRRPAQSVASAQLECIYREQGSWEKLTEVLLERRDHAETSTERIQLLMQVAKVYEEELGDAESAFIVLQAAFRENYSYEPVARNIERLATATGKWEELLADYSQVVAGLEAEEPAKAADLWVKIGQWYGDHVGHLDYAIHSVKAALRLDPQHLGALTALAEFHRKRGAWEELIEVLGRHAGLEPDPQRRVDLYLSLADLLETQLRDEHRAMDAYRSALKADGLCSEALIALDRLYRQNERWEDLIGVLERKAEASGIPDEQTKLKLEVGRLWDERLGEPAKAIDAFRSVLVGEPHCQTALRALERLYQTTGQTEQYLDVLDLQLDAALSDVERIGIYQRMAAAWETVFANLENTAACFEKILVLDERHTATHQELERLYRQERRWDLLVDTYRRHSLAMVDPAARIDLYCAMGQVYESELGDVDRAIEAYTDVLSFDPEEVRALEALGRLYERVEDWDRAIGIMINLVDSTGDVELRVRLHHRIGGILVEHLDDSTAAEERFLQALAFDGTHVPSMMSLCGLYKARGDWQKAARMMVRAQQQTQHPLERIRLLLEAAQISHHQLHDEARAMEYYAAVIALDPEHIEAGE
ncbi:MAG: tetratricopeptide repeat protein, partial [Pseudomonadota bacterium]